MNTFIKWGLALWLAGMTFLSNANANEQATSVQKAQTVDTVQAKQTALNPNLVNINTASVAELQDKLVGIGAKRAQAIVEYREKNGRFINLEQLAEVSGIGKATIEKNRDRLVLQ